MKTPAFDGRTRPYPAEDQAGFALEHLASDARQKEKATCDTGCRAPASYLRAAVPRHHPRQHSKVAMDLKEYWQDVVPTDGLKARSVRGASITALAQLPKIVLMLASQLVLARLLLPADFGLIAMVTPVIGFVQVLADLGLTQAVVSRQKLKLAELNGFFWINLGLSATLAIIAAALGPLLAWLYNEPRVMAVTFACSAMILVGGAGMVQSALLNRQMRYGALAIIEVCSLAISIALGVGFAWYGWSYWSLIFAQAGASVTSTGLSWAMSNWRPGSPSINRGSLSMAKFGGNITISNLANYLNTTIDNVMIGAVLGKVVLGLYDRAWKLAVQPLSQSQAPFHRVAVPTLSRLTEEPARYRQAFLTMTQAMLVMVAPAMLFASMLADPLITFVLGARWAPAAPIFAWICVGAIVTPVNSATLWLLVSQGRAREQMIFGTAAATINMLAYACGLPWGIVYVAAVSAVSVYLIQTPMLVWVATRQGPVGRKTIAALLLPNIVAAGATGLMLQQARQVFTITGFWLLAGTALATLASYMLVLVCFPTSRSQIKGIVMLPMGMLRKQRPDIVGDAS
ncbi:MAG: lipopolysaccharide biosynthesis protein [Sphingomonas sp.]|nr:MAG: lipopolysaccharide biosynthesis protein [Sphingomonas sp.]